jgi:beta-N-acetylhexosaminidase
MTDDLSMKAMQGTFTERAQQALSAGCDVVLHCNGDMKEMKAVAMGANSLAGESLKRAQAAICSVNPVSFDVAEARIELNKALTKAA